MLRTTSVCFCKPQMFPLGSGCCTHNMVKAFGTQQHCQHTKRQAQKCNSTARCQACTFKDTWYGIVSLHVPIQPEVNVLVICLLQLALSRTLDTELYRSMYQSNGKLMTRRASSLARRVMRDCCGASCSLDRSPARVGYPRSWCHNS